MPTNPPTLAPPQAHNGPGNGSAGGSQAAGAAEPASCPAVRIEVIATAPPAPSAGLEVSVVMPCLNEAETVGTCIAKALSGLHEAGVRGEVIVADNGSTDGSIRIAADAGARVAAIEERGYGAALRGGILAARGRYVIMGDADDSYDFSRLEAFIRELRAGNDLVMGNRFAGGIAPGAMPPLHRWLGNPVLSFIGRRLFKSPCRDFHCGLRGFSREAFERMNLRTTGMEFASEMVAKAALLKMRVTEVPTTLSPAGRSRPPHLRSFRDGWRHLRFMLLYSPRWLFLYPGLCLLGLGLVVGAWLLPGARTVAGVTFDVHTLLCAAAAVLVGVQAITVALFTETFARVEGFIPEARRLVLLPKSFTLERGLIAAAAIALAGVVLVATPTAQWALGGFGDLAYARTMRWVIPGVTLLAAGAQGALASLFLGILKMRRT